MAEPQSILAFIESLPLLGRFVHWLTELPSLPAKKILEECVEAFLKILGATEFIKWMYRRVSGRKGRMERKLELLEEESRDLVHTGKQKDTRIAALASEAKEARALLPDFALGAAHKEWRDENQDLGARVLERWFAANSAQIAEIAYEIGKHHIAHAIPEPGEHLKRARAMLTIAQAAAPDGPHSKDLWLEFDATSHALQAQVLMDGEVQVAWNSRIELAALVRTLRDVASHCIGTGRWRLALLFADRASCLARGGGAAMRGTWLSAETTAARYQMLCGEVSNALVRITRVLSEAGSYSLEGRDLKVSQARHVRAEALARLGRLQEALTEIATFEPIQAEILGARHPEALAARYLRAQTLMSLGLGKEAMKEIEAFAPIQAEVLGANHYDVLSARHLHAQTLLSLGRNEDALSELEALAPAEMKSLGARHPHTLSTRHLRAVTLQAIDRDEEALSEIDAFLPTEAEVLGAQHPSVLGSRYTRAKTLQSLGRNEEALHEITAFLPMAAVVLGAQSHSVLRSRHLRAKTLLALGRDEEALSEIDAILPMKVEALGAQHPSVLRTQGLREDALRALGRDIDDKATTP